MDVRDTEIESEIHSRSNQVYLSKLKNKIDLKDRSKTVTTTCIDFPE